MEIKQSKIVRGGCYLVTSAGVTIKEGTRDECIWFRDKILEDMVHAHERIKNGSAARVAEALEKAGRAGHRVPQGDVSRLMLIAFLDEELT